MAGILHCLEPDHIRRGRQGKPTHFLSQDGNTPKQFCGTTPPTDKTLCCPVSHLFLFWQKLTCGLLYLSTQACSPFCLFGTLPFRTQPLFFLRCHKYVHWALEPENLEVFFDTTGLHLYSTMLSPAILLQLQYKSPNYLIPNAFPI